MNIKYINYFLYCTDSMSVYFFCSEVICKNFVPTHTLILFYSALYKYFDIRLD